MSLPKKMVGSLVCVAQQLGSSIFVCLLQLFGTIELYQQILLLPTLLDDLHAMWVFLLNNLENHESNFVAHSKKDGQLLNSYQSVKKTDGQIPRLPHFLWGPLAIEVVLPGNRSSLLHTVHHRERAASF